jgi:hypothetical protein
LFLIYLISKHSHNRESQHYNKAAQLISGIVAIGGAINEFDVVVLEEGWLYVLEEIYIRLVVPALNFDCFIVSLAHLQATVVIGRPGLAV